MLIMHDYALYSLIIVKDRIQGLYIFCETWNPKGVASQIDIVTKDFLKHREVSNL